MKKTLLLWMLFIASFPSFAQFTAQDIKFWFGEGTQETYLIVDFKDGTDDRSYAWGYHFNPGDNKTYADVFDELQQLEPAFTYDGSGGWLENITFNHHDNMDAGDYWSLWNGTAADQMSMGGGVGTRIVNGLWFGASYGWSNPEVQAPAQPLPAYFSQWFNAGEITTWIGNGSQEIVLVIDFVTGNENTNNSYAWGLRFDGTLNYRTALERIAEADNSLQLTFDNNQITGVRYLNHQSNALWNAYTGSNLSNWQSTADLEQNFNSSTWLGLSPENTRRPFTPVDASPRLGNAAFAPIALQVYPNPTNAVLNIDTALDINGLELYSSTGILVAKTPQKHLNISALSSGVYLLKIDTNAGVQTKKIIKN